MEFGGDEVDRDMGSLASQEDRARDRRRIKEFREKTNPSSIGNAHVFSSSESGRETERAKNLSAKEKYPRLPKMTRKLSTGSEIDSVLMDRYRSGQNIFAAMNGPSIPGNFVKNEWNLRFFSDKKDYSFSEFLRHPNKLENSFRNAFTYLETYSGVLENWAAQKDIIDRIKLQSNRRYSSRISDSEKLFLAQKIKNDVAHCVNQIPSVYFDPEFQVNDPEFFRPLTESQHFAVLQEKLSYYLDLIEINILSYIRYHSEAFFDALCSIQVTLFLHLF